MGEPSASRRKPEDVVQHIEELLGAIYDEIGKIGDDPEIAARLAEALRGHPPDDQPAPPPVPQENED